MFVLRRRPLLISALLSALAAPPAFAQQCGGVDVAAVDGAVVTTSSGGITCITAYDSAITRTGQLDAAFNLGTVSGPTSNTYDSVGELISSSNLNGTTHLTYDSAGHITEVVDPLNHSTTYQYDAQGNLTSVHDGSGIASYS